MFNQKIKEKYLATLTQSSFKHTVSLFEQSWRYEEKFSKDVALFSVEELEAMFSDGGFMEPETLRTKKGFCAVYADWYCVQLGLAGHAVREYDIFSFPYKDFFKNTLVLSAEELVSLVYSIYSPESAQPVIPALCMAWLGVDCADALLLERADVKLLNDVPPAILDALNIYDNTDTAEREQGQAFKVYAASDGQFIKKMVSSNSKKDGKPFSTRQMSALIRDFNALLDAKGISKTLSYTNVQRSGNFYRLHQLAKSGVDVYDIRNKDLVRSVLGKSKRNHKDNMILYTAYKEIRAEAGLE